MRQKTPQIFKVHNSLQFHHQPLLSKCRLFNTMNMDVSSVTFSSSSTLSLLQFATKMFGISRIVTGDVKSRHLGAGTATTTASPSHSASRRRVRQNFSAAATPKTGISTSRVTYMPITSSRPWSSFLALKRYSLSHLFSNRSYIYMFSYNPFTPITLCDDYLFV